MLSLFDGVGAAVAILENLFGTSTAAMAWETDRTCRRLTSHRLPWLQQRGDFGNETVEKVVAEIRRLDPAGECVVLMIAAPPCQDFSRIGAETGHSGTRGSLFLRSAEFVLELRAALRGWRVGFMFENVVMQPAAAKEVSDCLGVEPILVCASDFGWISRPRLWWISGDLRRRTEDPATGAPLAWTKKGPSHRLRMEEARAAPGSLLPKGMAFHPAVASSRLLLSCATTPAEDENGRPAPKRARGKIPEPARARWLADCRQFALWHYAEEAMLHDEAGRLTTSAPALRRPSTRYRRATLTWETATSARGTGWWPMVGTGGAAPPRGAAGGGFGAGRPQDHHGVVDGGPVRRRTPGHELPTPPGVTSQAGYGAHRHMAPRCGADPRRGAG